MLQKVLKFANYAVAVLVLKIMLSVAPIMPKIMLAQSANAYISLLNAKGVLTLAVQTQAQMQTKGKKCECNLTQTQTLRLRLRLRQ